MKYLTANHYNDFEFELSYMINGQWREDIYISIDPVDDSIHGLPADLEDHEDEVLNTILENWGDILEDLKAVAQAEYDDYVRTVLG